jgi:HrpA-like RNA helicase
LIEIGAIFVDTSAEEKAVAATNIDDRSAILSKTYVSTALGRKLASLPCDPRSGKILLAARHLGCVKSAAVFVASLDSKSVFLKGSHSDEFFKNKFGKRSDSDPVAIVNAYSEWMMIEKKGHKFDWCRANGISMNSMVQIAGVANDLLQAISEDVISYTPNGISCSSRCLTCRSDIGMHTCVTDGTKELLHAAIVAGVGSNVSFRATPEFDIPAGYVSSTKNAQYCRVHKSSIISNFGTYIVYCSQMINNSGIQYLSNVAVININTILFFSPWIKSFVGDGTVVVGRGIGIKCKPQTLAALRKIKFLWENLLMEDNISCEASDIELISIIKEMVTI